MLANHHSSVARLGTRTSDFSCPNPRMRCYYSSEAKKRCGPRLCPGQRQPMQLSLRKLFMKKVLILVIGVCLSGLIVPSTTFAAKADGKKAKLIAKYDKNGNGIIDGEEKDALRKDFAADPKGDLKQYDTNGDGKLSDEEIAAIKPGATKKGGGKKDKANTETTSPAPAQKDKGNN